MARLASSAARFGGRLLGLMERFPWLGWAIWTVVVAAVLLRTHPRRYGAAFQYYYDYAGRLWAQQPLYDPSTLGDVSYWPTSLLLMVPLTVLHTTPAAAVSFAIFAALLTWAAIVFMRALLDDRPGAIWVAGLWLAANAWPGWYHFKQVQLQIPMVAAMVLATAAMMRKRWIAASLWLDLALIVKPLAVVMMLLAGALIPRMRLLVIAGILVAAALPFAFLPWDYLTGQYRALGLKLWAVATAPPGEWIYQADFTTLLRGLHVVLPGKVTFAIRLIVALGTLWLAWRVRRTNDQKAFALSLLMLSGLYIALFGPRNETVSYLVATPAITAVAFLMLMRNAADLRGWLLIVACQALGYVVDLPVDVVTKPAITLAVYVWVAFLMADPRRWCSVVSAPLPAISASRRSEIAATSA